MSTKAAYPRRRNPRNCNAMLMSLAAALLATQVSTSAVATDAPTDPVVAALDTKLDILNDKVSLAQQENELLKSKFGAPAAAPTGAINAPEKFGAIAQWAAHELYGDAATQASSFAGDSIKSLACPGVFVTSTPDKRATIAAAQLIADKLDSLTVELNKIATPPPGGNPRFAIAAAALALTGIIGSLDSIVGLFRADYSIADIPSSLDDLSARVAVGSKLGSGKPAGFIIVEGMDQRTEPSALLAKYKSFDTARSSAQAKYAAEAASAKSDAEKATAAEHKALLDAAAAYDIALTTPAAGVTPITAASVTYEIVNKKLCVMYVKVVGFATTAITRKRLLSRNDDLTIVSGANLQFVLFDEMGAFVKADLFKFDWRVGARLGDVIKSATPMTPAKDASNDASAAVPRPQSQGGR
jgi:hypothetical protein